MSRSAIRSRWSRGGIRHRGAIRDRWARGAIRDKAASGINGVVVNSLLNTSVNIDKFLSLSFRETDTP